MVAVYAYLINPGQAQSVYDAAAQHIAPWSSHVVGPLLFLWWNYRGAARVPTRPATVFALTSIVFYFLADMATVPLFRLSFSQVLTLTFFLSLASKTAGAVLGARLGKVRLRTNSDMHPTSECPNG